MTLRAVYLTLFLAVSGLVLLSTSAQAGGTHDSNHASQFKNYVMFSYSEFERKIPGSRDATV